MKHTILLSFDLEEFDAPLEHGQPISEDEQMQVSSAGLSSLLRALDTLNVQATFFTTAHFADQHPAVMQELISRRHEVASHGYFHGTFQEADLLSSKVALERITGENVAGFRRARMEETDSKAILAAGYLYNASSNPTWIPGRYNHFFAPRTVHLRDGLLNIPASVTPVIRFPLFWLSVKNVPLSMLKIASRWTLATDQYLSLYFHPWEFADLRGYTLPQYMKRLDGDVMLTRLVAYVRWLQGLGEFVSFRQFALHTHLVLEKQGGA